MIDLDYTFFIQLVNFVVILVLLNVLLITPVRDIMKKRAAHMAGQMETIEGFTSKADAKLADYEKALDEARKAAVAGRMKAKDEGGAAEKEILDAAGKKAADFMAASRAEIASQAGKARETVLAGVGDLAAKAVGKILGGAA